MTKVSGELNAAVFRNHYLMPSNFIIGWVWGFKLYTLIIKTMPYKIKYSTCEHVVIHNENRDIPKIKLPNVRKT